MAMPHRAHRSSAWLQARTEEGLWSMTKNTPFDASRSCKWNSDQNDPVFTTIKSKCGLR